MRAARLQSGRSLIVRYSADGLIVRSENAAKPPNRAALPVLEWIASLPEDARVLDMGCGKLRYTIPLSEQCGAITAVDSKVQLDRLQQIEGERTTIRDLSARTLPRVRLGTLEDDTTWGTDFTHVLCANVLSAIPDEQERRSLLEQFSRRLVQGGEVLLVTQYGNSHFDGFRTHPRARRYLDGWLVRYSATSSTASFYGLIGPDRLAAYAAEAGLDVLETRVVNRSAHVIARKHSA